MNREQVVLEGRARACPTCGQQFTPGRSLVYCSMACYANRPTTWVARSCEQCGRDFCVEVGDMRPGRARFCSKRCNCTANKPSTALAKARVAVTCGWCGTAMSRPPNEAVPGIDRFCNKSCRRLFENAKVAHVWPRDPRGSAARWAVGRAVKTGRLLKPTNCQSCGTSGRIEGHHDDYSRPLVVRWLCNRCHRRHHLSSEVA